jgi:hypothetical protein
VPWTSPECSGAGTVHLGGDIDEVVAGELAVHRGSMPERPFVLIGQQYLADPSRSVGDVHPLWTYAHVPNGYAGDATEAIITQIERFAPGFRERIVGMAVRSTTEMAQYNPNYVGGDIIGGASSPMQILFRPASRSTRTPPASRAPTSAPRRRLPAPAPTACAAPTPPPVPSPRSDHGRAARGRDGAASVTQYGATRRGRGSTWVTARSQPIT